MLLLHQKSRLLMDEAPLVIQPSLAVLLGLNEAILLQQIHYWITRSSHKDTQGRAWAYNSVAAWRDQFPFWSISTIKRGIAALEKMGILLSCNHNKASFDKTKWYTIDYDRLAELEQGKEAAAQDIDESDPVQETPWDDPGSAESKDDFLHEEAPEAPVFPLAQNDPIERPNLTQPLVQSDPIEQAILTQPIPETTQRLPQIQDDDDSSRRTEARARGYPAYETGPSYEDIGRLIDKRFLNIVPGEAAAIVQEAQERGYSPLALFRLIAEAAPYYETITRPSAYIRRIMTQWEDIGRLEDGGDAAW